MRQLADELDRAAQLEAELGGAEARLGEACSEPARRHDGARPVRHARRTSSGASASSPRRGGATELQAEHVAYGRTELASAARDRETLDRLEDRQRTRPSAARAPRRARRRRRDLAGDAPAAPGRCRVSLDTVLARIEELADARGRSLRTAPTGRAQATAATTAFAATPRGRRSGDRPRPRSSERRTHTDLRLLSPRRAGDERGFRERRRRRPVPRRDAAGGCQARRRPAPDAGRDRAGVGLQPERDELAPEREGLHAADAGHRSALGVTNPYDPLQSIDARRALPANVLDRFDGDRVLALAAYNAGGGAVESTAACRRTRTITTSRRRWPTTSACRPRRGAAR